MEKKLTINLISITVFFSFCIFVFPFNSVSAQQIPNNVLSGDTGGLVPCSGNECGTCHVVQLANNVTDIIIDLALGISVLIFMYAGWLMISAAGNSTQIKKGKDVMLNVLVGLIIILTAWLVVDVMLKSLLPGGQVKFGTNAPMPWNQIVCSNQKDLKDGVAVLPESSGWQLVQAWQNDTNTTVNVCGATPAGNTDCSAQVNSCLVGGGSYSIDTNNPNRYTVNCVSSSQSGPNSTRTLCSATPNGANNNCTSQMQACINSGGSARQDQNNANSYYVVCTPLPTAPSSSNLNLITYGGRQFASSVVSNVQYIDQNFGLRLTSGYRTPTQNANADGTQTSWYLTGRAADFVGTQSQMQAAQQWAQQNGAREALIHNAGSGTHLHVAW